MARGLPTDRLSVTNRNLPTVHPQNEKPAAPLSRNDGLDLIRAVAAALVFATHLYHKTDAQFLGPLAQGGHIAVWMFFALSGYLLYRPFLGSVDLRKYAVSRVARLAPAYYLAALVIGLSGLEPGMVANPLPTLLVAVNMMPSEPLGLVVFGQAWTLGIEVAFYASLPLVAWLVRSRPWLLVALIVATWMLTTFAPIGQFWRWQLVSQFWAFGAGMLVARYAERLRLAARLWPLGVVLIIIGLLKAAAWQRGDFEVVLGTALVILGVATYRPSIPWARFPANISYAVYLWHVAAIFVARDWLGLSGVPLVLAAVAGTIAVASASWFLLEQPVLAGVRAWNDQRRASAGRARAGTPRPAVAPTLEHHPWRDAPARVGGDPR